MKKSIKRFLLVCLLAISVCNPIYTEAATSSDMITPYYVNIQNAEAFLTLNGSQAIAETKIYTKKKLDISITMKLQKKSGSSWTTVKTWTESKKDSVILNVNKTYTISSGTYRIYSTVSAGTETITLISSTKTY